MEVYPFFLCCALFAAVAAFTIHDEVTENNVDINDPSYADCKCKNGRCVKNSSGKMKCNCPPGHALQDESTCERCDCGERGKCMFRLHPNSAGSFVYEKECLCDLGYAEKDGQCIDCHCGEHSKCEFEGDEKICYCIDGFSEKDGVCTECDCGFYGECKFEFGQKKCLCDEGFVEKDGICEVRCDVHHRPCENGGRCSEVGICSCLEGTSGDFCGSVDECDHLCPQHPNIECAFDPHSLRAFCKCTDERKGFHPETQECRTTCDDDFHVCMRGGECVKSGHSRFCNCLAGTAGDYCELVPECSVKDCGADAVCVYDIAQRSAVCECRQRGLAFDQEDRRCKKTCGSQLDCRNGGSCHSSHFCRCLDGTSGDFCERVPLCDNKDCGDVATCIYSIEKRTAVCACEGDVIKYDPVDMSCKRTCESNSDCQNGGTCSLHGSYRFCNCLLGTNGDFCENVLGCVAKDCGQHATCEFDISTRSGVCLCQDEYLSFDVTDKTCKNTCQGSSACKNGADCTGHGASKFCRCLRGTNGDFCENVIECYSKDCGHEAGCSFDVPTKSAICKCHDRSLSFDIVDKRCKNTCQDHYDCKNGADCTGDEASKFCRCLRGTNGDFCENVIGCESINCGPEARCLFDVPTETAICNCKDRNLSFDIMDKTCKRACEGNKGCDNGGTCRTRMSSTYAFRFCDCLRGTSGDLCQTVDECARDPNKCKDGSRCSFDFDKEEDFCRCPDEDRRYDPLEGKCKYTCDQDALCLNGGFCMHRGGHLFCVCKEGTSGTFCEVVEDCERGACGFSNDTVCRFDIHSETVRCGCKDANARFDPETKTCKVCDCGRNSISCSFEQDGKMCHCKEGFDDEDGTCKKKWCTEKKCFHGKCDVIDDVEVCSCHEGYELDGDYCRKLNCSKTACINGTCIVRRGNVEKCVCPAGYTLNRNTCIRGVCRIDTCYGGRCQKIEGELMCVCPEKFHLEGIGCYETVCENQHCFGGKCVVEKGEEICTCLEGYTLDRNVCKKIICKKNCFGGQCHMTNGVEECTCPKGYFLFEDVCREIQTRKQ